MTKTKYNNPMFYMYIKINDTNNYFTFDENMVSKKIHCREKII